MIEIQTLDNKTHGRGKNCSRKIEMEILLVLIGLVGVSVSQVILPGRCPRVDVEANFDVNRYTGVWYEFENYPFLPEATLKCVQAEYTLSDGEVIVENTGINQLTGQVSQIEGVAKIRDPSTPAKLGVSFFRFQPTSPYWVLDTDYDNYSLVFSCSNLGLIHTKVVWILTRSRSGVSEVTLNSIYSKLRSYGISPRRLKRTNQTGCVA